MHKQKTDEKSIRLKATKICPACQRLFDENSEHSVCPDDNTALHSVSETAEPVPAIARVGTSIGCYRIVSKIAEGSSSVVFAAQHLESGEQAAVKLLHLNLLSDPVAVKNFQQQVEAIRSLNHENIAAVKEFGVLANGQPYLVMEFVASKTLAELLGEQGSLDWQQCVKIFAGIAEALVAAHCAGIFHRDIKPSNIMFDRHNGVKVLDFGIAKITGVGTSDTVTRTGVCMGTPAYMSPEQCFGGTVDGRSDIYSLGCLMYECLSHSQVFPSENAFNCMNKHAFEKPRPLGSLVNIPLPLAGIVMSCLEKNPERRIKSMEELRAALLKLLSGDFLSRAQSYAFLLHLVFRRSGKPDKIYGGLGGAVAASVADSGRSSFGRFALVALLLILIGTATIVLLQRSTRFQADLLGSASVPKVPGRELRATRDEVPGPDEQMLMQQFSDIGAEIAALEKSNETARAQAMASELLVYRDMFEKEISDPAFKGNVVNSIAVQKGLGAISSKNGNQLSGVVNIDVTYKYGPVILILSSEDPVIWRINKAEGVKIPKVILANSGTEILNVSASNHEIPEGKFKGAVSEMYMERSSRWGDKNYKKLDQIAREQLNGEVVSLLNRERARDSIIVGPEDDSWRAQFVMWRMSDFYKRCMERQTQAIQGSLKKYVFDGIWPTGDYYNPSLSLAQLTPYGAKKSSLHQLADADLKDAMLVNLPGEKPTWFLLSDGRSNDDGGVLKYDPQTRKTTTLPSILSDDNLPWWAFRNITYDTKRNLIYLLAQQDPPLYVFDPRRQKWSNYKIKLPYGIELISAVYSREDDAIYCFGCNLLEHPYQSYLYKLEDGKIAKTVQLSENLLETPDPSIELKLRDLGRYFVATVINRERSHPDAVDQIPGPLCAVFSRDGRVIYRGYMKVQP